MFSIAFKRRVSKQVAPILNWRRSAIRNFRRSRADERSLQERLGCNRRDSRTSRKHEAQVVAHDGAEGIYSPIGDDAEGSSPFFWRYPAPNLRSYAGSYRSVCSRQPGQYGCGCGPAHRDAHRESGLKTWKLPLASSLSMSAIAASDWLSPT